MCSLKEAFEVPQVQINNVYDLLAWICSAIADWPSDEQKSLTCKYDMTQKTKSIEAAFDFLNMKAPDKEKSYEFLSEEQIKIICDKVCQWSQTPSDKIYILYLLTYLAGYFDFNSAFAHFLTDCMCNEVTTDVWSFVALNSNYQEVGGALVPKFKTMWEKENIRTSQELDFSPFSLLPNYLWIPQTIENEEWESTHLYISDKSIGINRNEPLMVIASSGQRENTFKFHCDDEIKKFIIEKYNDNACKRLQEKIKYVLDSAANQNAHIVLFPEMVASQQLQSNMCHYLSESNNEYPALICLPSTEFAISKETNKYCNSTLIVNGSGEKLTEYHKQHPFRFDQESKTKTDEMGNPLIEYYYEPIEPDRKINVFHVKGVGRIGLVICADVFHKNLLNYLFNVLQINVLLVMAYTKGTDIFFRALNAANIAYCDVIWCNACAAYDKPLQTAPVISCFSFGHKQKQQHICKYCGKGEDECCSCLAMIKIATEYARDNDLEFCPI